MNTFQNPVITQTNSGEIIPASCNNERGVIRSHLIVLDSRLRDFNRYPNANHFRLNLPREYKGVFSIELLNATIPIVGTENYVIMSIAANGRALAVLDGAQTNSITQQIFTNLFDDAFVKIPLIQHFAAQTTTFWKKDELRAVFYPKPRFESIRDIEITLEQYGPAGSAFGTTVPYPLAPVVPPITVNPSPADNISLVIEIVASS